MTTISMAEVKKHNKKNSVWIIIHNNVYDVTKFLSEHPGGTETLLGAAGKDASQAFEDVGHSDDARELLKKFKIGTLPADEINSCSCRWWLWLLLLAAAAAGGAFAYKKYSS